MKKAVKILILFFLQKLSLTGLLTNALKAFVSTTIYFLIYAWIWSQTKSINATRLWFHNLTLFLWFMGPFFLNKKVFPFYQEWFFQIEGSGVTILVTLSPL